MSMILCFKGGVIVEKFERYAYVDGKKMKRGYTTGSCAAAATKAALIFLLSKEKVESVKIITPKNIEIEIPIKRVEENFAVVEKDGGDDIDATHGMDIVSKVSFIDVDENIEYRAENKDDKIVITAGEGIGRITKKGLKVPIGRPAINPTPVEMIEDAVNSTIEIMDIDIPNGKKILVEISAPIGLEISKRTFNPNLGIVGGISILGTTGIVEPMSEESWKSSISMEMNMKKEAGFDTIVLAPGNIGVEILCEKYGYDKDSVVKMSNFIGYVLMESKRLDFEKIVIAGHIGKLIKLSAGIMNTHSRVADARTEIMISNLAMMGADIGILKDIQKSVTTDAMIPIIKKNGYEKVFYEIADKARKRAEEYMRDEKKRKIEVYLFAMNGEMLGFSK